MDSTTHQVAIFLRLLNYMEDIYPTIVVGFPPTYEALTEISWFRPKTIKLEEMAGVQGASYNLWVDDALVAVLDDRNGNFKSFRDALKKAGVFLLMLIVNDNGAINVGTVLTRVMLAENYTGKVIKNRGPSRTSYEKISIGGPALSPDEVQRFVDDVQVTIHDQLAALIDTDAPSETN
jgi:hypothetical protein